MSDIKFACPACQQHISADQGYAGMEIACPACSARMIVPGTPARVSIPAPVPSPAYVPPPPAPSQYATSPATASGCPSCGAVLPRGAVICTKCGYNIATKQRIVAGRVVAPGKAMAPRGDVKWYATPYPYLGVLGLVYVVLYALAHSNDGMKIVYLLSCALFIFTAHICVVVSAFKDSVGKGFLCLCIGIYAIYYTFKESDSTLLKTLIGISLALELGIYTLKD